MYSPLQQEAIFDSFAILASILGIYSGFYLIRKARQIQSDKFLFVNFLILGLVDLWVAGIYVAILVGAIPDLNFDRITTGVYIRPATLFLLFIPAQVIRRLKL